MPRGAHALIGANRSGRFEMGRGTRIEYRGVCVCVVLALLCCCECVRGSLRFPSRTPIGAGEVGIGWKEDESATPASAAHGSDSEDEPSRVRRQTVSGKKGWLVLQLPHSHHHARIDTPKHEIEFCVPPRL